jgi:hypothetical protein
MDSDDLASDPREERVISVRAAMAISQSKD